MSTSLEDSREHIDGYIAAVLAASSPSTAKTRYGGLQAFFKYSPRDRF